ncbi:galactose-1-phosphate uridylyltransferase [Thermococcus alcaliphilus]|uniref:galactose-1-phosphate uridylyltransferase n=1 Tax=Thermococcus alcaliphilus TaxID=139207 RepID=UPI0020916835|nr:galactose-1-phosphate uridylyltransferase [Thermococcus alcaliphilus]MCO6042044.1 galactose-1-phosphate uridylyltransferase [Thermococcus alcaliphilus]
MRELRYNPLTGQWIMVSAVRRNRPWRPRDFCPFCPGTEETGYGWEVLLLPNRFPMLSFDAPKPEQEEFYIKARAIGQCSVIVETPEHELRDLDELPKKQMTKVVELWREVTAKLMENSRVAYLAIFRNKGEEIGVSLTHPHGQLYALPFIPLKARLKIENSRNYYHRFGECLFCRILKEEANEERAIYENESFIAFMPFFASWPFEIHVYPKRHVQYLTQLNSKETRNLADVLQVATGSLNEVLERDMPYAMMVFQAPFKGKYSFYHLHIEFYPILRDNRKIKYTAGIELGTWEFTYDGIPEENAEKLKEACRRVIKRLNAEGRCL